MIIGYTAGVFDLFHIGHLRLLQRAKGFCDCLVVGVTTDELAHQNSKKPIIPLGERMDIIGSLRCVDVVIPQENMDKVSYCKKLNASLLFVGDDWYETKNWKKYEQECKKNGIKVIYLPYTKHVSSSVLKCKIRGLDHK